MLNIETDLYSDTTLFPDPQSYYEVYFEMSPQI